MRKTRLLSWLLSAALLISGLPVMATSAAASSGSATETVEIPVEAFEDVSWTGYNNATVTHKGSAQANKFLRATDISSNSAGTYFKANASLESGVSYVLTVRLRSNSVQNRDLRMSIATTKMNGSTANVFNATGVTTAGVVLNHSAASAINSATGAVVSAADSNGWQTITVPFTVGTAATDTAGSFIVQPGIEVYLTIKGGTTLHSSTTIDIDDICLTEEGDTVNLFNDDENLFDCTFEDDAYVTGTQVTAGISQEMNGAGKWTVQEEAEYDYVNVTIPQNGSQYAADGNVTLPAGTYRFYMDVRMSYYDPDPTFYKYSSATAGENDGKVKTEKLGSVIRATAEAAGTPGGTAHPMASRYVLADAFRVVMLAEKNAGTASQWGSLKIASGTEQGGAKAGSLWTTIMYEKTYTAPTEVSAFIIRGTTSPSAMTTVEFANHTEENPNVLYYRIDNREIDFDVTNTRFVQVVEVPASDYTEKSVDLVLSADTAHLNPGETVKVDIIATTEETAAQQITALNVELDYDTENLTFKGIVPGDAVASEKYVYDTNNKKAVFAFMDDLDNSTAVKVFKGSDVVIATAEFTVDSDAKDGIVADFGVADASITLNGDDTWNGYDPAVSEDTVTLHNIELTVDTTNLDIGTVPAKLYAKYNSAALYTDAARSAVWTVPTVKAASGYRLVGNTWKLDNEDFALGTAGFTEGGVLSYPTEAIPTYRVTFDATDSDGIEFVSDYIDVAEGTKLLEAIAGKYTVDSNYTLNGWKIGDADVTAETTVTGNVTVVAQVSLNNAQITIAAKNANGGADVAGGGAALDSTLVGAKLTVTPTPVDDYVVTAVKYTVSGSTDEIALTYNSANGKWESSYTLAGGETVTVYYTKRITVTLSGTEGASVTAAEYYALEGSAGLYTDKNCTEAVQSLSTPQYTKDEANGVRYDAANSEKPWVFGGTNYSAADLIGLTYTAGGTITPNVKKQYKITFVAGANVTLEGTLEDWVDENANITVPTVKTPTDYYDVTWSETTPPATAVKAGTYTASASPKTFNWSLTDDSGSVSATTGVDTAANKVTHATDVTFTVSAAAEPTVVVTVGGASKPLTADTTVAGKYTYTIPGAEVIGDIAVTVTNQIAVIFSPKAEDAGADFEAATYYVLPGNALSADDIAAVAALPKAAAGYIFTGWVNVDEEPVTVGANLTFDASATFYAVFAKETYDVELADGLTADRTTAQVGDDIVITPESGRAVTAISYTVDGVNPTVINAAADGTFTIPGSAVTGKITVSIGTELTVKFITASEYKVLADNTKIAVILASANGTKYTLSNALDGDVLYYSSKLGGYAVIVPAATSAADLVKGITSVAEDAPVVVYDGDISEDGDTHSGDAAMLSAMLHNPNGSYTELARLRADVADGDSETYVSTYDCKWILKECVGLNPAP